MSDVKTNITSHPFEFVFSSILVLRLWRSVDMLLDYDKLPESFKVGLMSLPLVMLWTWVVMGLIGSLLIFAGLSTSSFTRKSRALEASGLWLSAAMWFSIGVSDLVIAPLDFRGYAAFFVITGGCMVRLIALNRLQRIISHAKDGF